MQSEGSRREPGRAVDDRGCGKRDASKYVGKSNITNGLKGPLGIKGSLDPGSFCRYTLEAEEIVASTVEVSAGGKA